VTVHKFYTNSSLRNYNYLFDLNESEVVAVDPLLPEQIEKWCKENGKTLKVILITHEHPDHIHGLEELRKKYKTELWSHETMLAQIGALDRVLSDGDIIDVHGAQLQILHTPGHTPTHICLLFSENGVQKEFIAMDTIFNAGVGHCKLGGNPNILYKTIKRIGVEIEDQVILHPGHDYIEKNLRFTLDREPDNKKAKELLEKVEVEGGLEIRTSMGVEKEINTFFRLTSQTIVENLPHETNSEEEVFITLRKLRDNF